MAVYLEFVVPGPPISNQQSTPSGRTSLAAWRLRVAAVVAPLWLKPLLEGNLKAIIINFFPGYAPSLDLDNMSKPILDVMQTIVYNNDRQIFQAELTHVHIAAAFTIVGVSKILVDAINTGSQFVYVRIEDAVDPFPLPKG